MDPRYPFLDEVSRSQGELLYPSTRLYLNLSNSYGVFDSCGGRYGLVLLGSVRISASIHNQVCVSYYFA